MDEEQRIFLADLFALLGPVALRAMFGGHGLYHAGRIIGIVVDGEVYLKTDTATRPAFEAADCHPFQYRAGGKDVRMSYWSVPAEAMESAQDMLPWAQRAHDAAVRAEQARTRARPRKRRPEG